MAETEDALSRGAGLARQSKAAAGRAVFLSRAARAGLAIVGIVQVAFAFLAFWDLASRKEKEVLGPKLVWIPVLLIKWIGPAAYFLFGIRHRR